ncbi:MAG TPA: DUF695 domain-containing protein [Caulobacter sp.]|nr:DUF695 domain-containing protein [Caulobacter sp.]
MAVGPFNDDEWTVGEARAEDGVSMIVRFRSHLPSAAAREDWRHLVQIGWSCESADDDGMPDDVENGRQDAFEDALQAQVESRGHGAQVASLTGGGVREWRYYTRDPEVFFRSLNEALASHPEYPLEFTVFEDPEWDGLSELLPPRN